MSKTEKTNSALSIILGVLIALVLLIIVNIVSVVYASVRQSESEAIFAYNFENKDQQKNQGANLPKAGNQSIKNSIGGQQANALIESDFEVENSNMTTDDNGDTQYKNISENQYKLTFSDLLDEPVQKDYILEDYRVKFAYPATNIIFRDSDLIYIFPKPTSFNETPVPVMKIVISQKKPNQTALSFAYATYKNMESKKEIEINGLKGLEISFHEVVDLYQTCGHIILEDNERFYDFFLYECFEWEPYQSVVESFTKVE